MKKNLLFIIPLIIISCSGITEVEITDVKNVEFKGFENNLVNLSLEVVVNNPNSFNIKVNEMNFKIYANNVYLGRIQSNTQTVIKRKTKMSYPMELQLRLANIFTGFSTFLSIKNSGTANVKLEGTVTGRSLLWKKTIDINESRSIKF
jgi:LEA14-like dessication related protein